MPRMGAPQVEQARVALDRENVAELQDEPLVSAQTVARGGSLEI